MTEHDVVTVLERLPSEGLTGRIKILIPVKQIDEQNLLEVLDKALAVHRVNARDIEYLWRYYKGVQDIRFKDKFVRQNINEKICVNRANEIVTFKSSFLLEEPIQYVSHGGKKKVSALVNQLNEYMRAADKEASDKSIVDWMHICGVGERLVLRPDSAEEDGVRTDAPFTVYSIDPRKAFVIYQDGIGEKPLAGVLIGKDEDGTFAYDVYTRDTHYFVKNETIKKLASPQYGGIPLIEYVNNEARMGAFEPVISILNGINLLESNAIDSVEDFVNAFDVFQNCDIADGDYSGLSVGGKAVKIKTVMQGMEAKVYRVSSEISQSGVQTRIDDLTSAYLEICGMPNRNGGSSTSDTGTAVVYRDGWSTAASRAKDTETLFRRSEKQFCRIALNICKNQNIAVPEITDFEPEFLAHKLSNLQSRVQALCQMLGNPYIHPQYAYASAGAGVFDDVESAYRAGMEWNTQLTEKQEQALNDALDQERERLKNGSPKTVQTGGQSDSDSEQESGVEV